MGEYTTRLTDEDGVHLQDRKTVVAFVGNKSASAKWPINYLTDGKLRQAFGESHR